MDDLTAFHGIIVVSSSTVGFAAVPAILDYLNAQNRPYSAVDILNNLHKEYGKAVKSACISVQESDSNNEN